MSKGFKAKDMVEMGEALQAGFRNGIRTEPFTLDEVMEFVDSIEMNDIDKYQLKCMIAEIADHRFADQVSFQNIRLSNGNAALLDKEKGRVYHSYMHESFMERIGLSYKVVDDE